MTESGILYATSEFLSKSMELICIQGIVKMGYSCRRRRAISVFTVDNITNTGVFMGNDFEFGKGNFSNVWIGGLPQDCVSNLISYSLPSVCLDPRYNGSIRNVIYNNCTCQSTRVAMLDGSAVESTPAENCDIRDPCGSKCVCVSTDVGEPDCDCSQMGCLFG